MIIKYENLHIRVDEITKNEIKEMSKNLGLSMSGYIMFIHKKFMREIIKNE
jgi:antitoxin component of RelBE/YafQ-DinJ toxin-antitoxin module